MTDISIKNILLDFVKNNKASVLGYAFFSLATPISNVYLPHLYGQLISKINETKEINQDIQIRFAVILLLWVVVQVMWASMNRIDSNFTPKLRAHVREHIVDVVMDAYSQDYSEEELGGILSEIVRLPDEIDHMFHNIRNHILPMTYLLTFSVGYFTYTNPKLGAMATVSIGLYLGLAVYFSRRCMSTWSEMNSSHDYLHGEINDCLGNLLNIYTANQVNYEKERLQECEQDFYEKHRSTILCAGNFRLTLNLSYIFLFCSINIVSFYLYSKRVIDISDVISVLIITLELVSKMAGFVGSIDRIMYEFSTIEHVQKSLNLLAQRHRVSDTNYKPIINGDIRIENLYLSYGDHPSLRGINLVIPQGSRVALVGEIGSGKTSLINSIIRLTPYTGRIFIGDDDIKSINLGHLRDNVLYVPQNPKLFNRTVWENIAYSTNATKEHVKNLLQQYNIGINPDKNVGKNGQWLSGGQRQIVYLLRCLIKKTPIIILDEPTASLDSVTKNYIMDILADLFIDRTAIIVSHDPEVLKFVDNVIEMNNGRL